jgi:hypothetical protein
MAELDPLADGQQLCRLGRPDCAGLNVEPAGCPQYQHGVAQGFGRRHQHQVLRGLGQLTDAPEVVALDVRRKPHRVGKLEAGQLGCAHPRREFQQCEGVPTRLADNPVSDATVEPAGHDIRQQRAGILFGQPFEAEFG